MRRKQKYETPLRIICAVLFATFSFLYIYMFQGELLALVQDHLSDGRTTNNTLITATLITLLLMLLQHLINRVGKLHGDFEALSYLPSCALLALITKVDRTFLYSWVQWSVALLVVALLYVFVIWLNRNTYHPREVKFLKLLIPNLGALTILFMFVGLLGANNSAVKMELAAWKYTHDKNFEKVLVVGNHSDDYNANLTTLRNFALIKTGKMGELLFNYPQPYGSDGLLMNCYNVQTPKYGAKEYYELLGSRPYGGEKAAAFYKRMMRNTSITREQKLLTNSVEQCGVNEVKYDSVLYCDLYAAALLLDRNLNEFTNLTVDVMQLPKLPSGVPLHYQEAWMIYNEQHPFTPIAFIPDSAVVRLYQEYLALREAYVGNPVVLQNHCKRQFGNTYWYYYDFGF